MVSLISFGFLATVKRLLRQYSWSFASHFPLPILLCTLHINVSYESNPFLARETTVTIKLGSDHIIWIFGNIQKSPPTIFLVICCLFLNHPSSVPLLYYKSKWYPRFHWDFWQQSNVSCGNILGHLLHILELHILGPSPVKLLVSPISLGFLVTVKRLLRLRQYSW